MPSPFLDEPPVPQHYCITEVDSFMTCDGNDGNIIMRMHMNHTHIRLKLSHTHIVVEEGPISVGKLRRALTSCSVF